MDKARPIPDAPPVITAVLPGLNAGRGEDIVIGVRVLLGL